MLNFRYGKCVYKNKQPNGYIQIILLQFKLEYAQFLCKPYVCQYKITSKLY